MAILDQFGRPIAALKRPETRELTAISIRDRWSSYPSEGLTPGRMREILRTADYGWLRETMELFEEMEEKDTHLAAILQTRKLALTGMRWEIQPASDSSEDQKIAELVRQQFDAIGDFPDDLLDLLDAIGKGYSVSEILWDYNAGSNTAVVRDLRWIHPKRVSFLNVMTPRILTDEEPTMGVDPKPFQIIFHRYRARSGLETRTGVLRTVALPYLLKNYAWKDWAVFNEVFGMPLRVGKYDLSASPADRAALALALRSLGTDAAAIISKSTEIEFVEAGMRASGTLIPFHVMIEACNSEMSKAVLGQTLTSDTSTGGKGGSLAMAKVHDEVRQDLVMADAAALARTLKDQLIRPIVGFNFGWDKPIPSFSMLPEAEEDLKALSEVYTNLHKIGYPLTVEHISERFGVPMPEKGQEILRNSTSPPPGDPAQVPGGPAEAAPEGSQTEEPVPPGDKGKGGKVAMKAGLETNSDTGVPPVDLKLAIQKELENLTQAANAKAQAYLGKMLAPVAHLIDSGESLEAIKGELLELYSRIDTGSLAVLMGQVRIMANLRGRVNG